MKNFLLDGILFPAAIFALMIIGGVILFALITFLLDKKISGGRD